MDNHKSYIIALTGMMGCGKTSIGKLLAPMLSLNFIDIDSYIKNQYGMSIGDIFAQKGEAYFRAIEEEITIDHIADGYLLSLGGGAFMNKNIRQALKNNNAVSIYLKTDCDILWSRLCHKTDRPLLQNPNPREFLENLLQQRDPIYQEANIIISTNNRDKDLIAKNIVDELKLYHYP